MIPGIIVGVICDAWVVASGCVLERGDRFRGHRIFQSVSSGALKAHWLFAERAI
jgi:hypothetical protein